MNLSGNKKIVMLGLSLLILAGIIVVALRGTVVDLMVGQHKSMNIVIGKEFEVSDMESICKEVFKDKKTVIRKIEVFEDSVNINVVSITDEEKTNLISKINEKYSLELDASQITVNSNSNIRIRDIVKPYFAPVGISIVLVYLYIAIRFKKLNPLKVLGWLTAYLLITEATIASIIAIFRISLSPVVINLMLLIAVVEIMLYINKKEKDLVSLSVEKSKKKKESKK